MRPLRALHLALICHTTQGRLSRSRSRVHHSAIHHATMHHPITFGYSLVDRDNASAGVRAGRFLATYLEPVRGLEWVPRA